MAWGISGDVGEIFRKQQSDELRDQLLRQQMAQRMKEFEAEQVYRQQQMAAQAEDRKARIEESAANRRMDWNRIGLDEMRMTRQQMTDEDERQKQAGQERAVSNIQGLIPFRQSPEGQAEIAAQALRVSPAQAVSELLREPPKPTKYRVTVPGPGGRPMATVKTEDELGQGVEEYRAPDRPQRTEMTPGQQFQATRGLRNDFVRETRAARTVQQQLAMMDSSLAAARKGDLAAGSQGVLVTFQKILDPNSVVRESEYARSAAGQSLLSRMEGAATRLISGGAGVPVDELEKFVALGKQFVQGQAEAARETKTQIDAIATEFGIDPKNITREYGEPAGGGGGGAPMRKPIPGIPGAEAESTDGGKTWKRVK